MFLAISRFAVTNGLEASVREAFRMRPHKVDAAPGFIRMEVANPSDDPAEFWLLTWWQDEASFKAWHHSHAYHESHQGMPKGLKLDPERSKIMHFKVFAS